MSSLDFIDRETHAQLSYRKKTFVLHKIYLAHIHSKICNVSLTYVKQVLDICYSIYVFNIPWYFLDFTFKAGPL